MPELKLVVQAELDGAPLPNFPLIFRQVVTESVPLDGVQKAPDNNATTFSPLPGAFMPVGQALILTADKAINLQFNNAGALPLNANAVIVILGANLTTGPSTNITINNPAASGTGSANLNGLVAGT